MSAPSHRRSRLPTEAVQFRQRARILDATARSVSQLGYADCSVEEVAHRAGVSKRTFYARYHGKEHVVAEAYGAAAALAQGTLGAAMAGGDEWHEAVAATIAAYVSLLECDLAWARFCVVEAPAAGSAVAARRNAVVDDLLGAIDRAVPPGAAPAVDARLVVEAVDGAVRSWLGQEHPAAGPEELVEQLTRLALAPYRGRGGVPRVVVAPLVRAPDVPPRLSALDAALGRLPSSAAVGEIAGLVARGVEANDGQLLWRAVVGLQEAAERHPDPALDAVVRAAARGMREASIFGLVRTGAPEAAEWHGDDQRSRCLRYVAAHPGSSGVEIRDGLGLRDPAQVSRLLAGLEGAGLIETPRPRVGRANAWRLTAAGRRALAREAAPLPGG